VSSKLGKRDWIHGEWNMKAIDVIVLLGHRGAGRAVGRGDDGGSSVATT
jgi:hypothetical protein